MTHCSPTIVDLLQQEAENLCRIRNKQLQASPSLLTFASHGTALRFPRKTQDTASLLTEVVNAAPTVLLRSDLWQIFQNKVR